MRIKHPVRKPDKVRLGKSRHFDRAPLTSDLPRLADVLWVGRHVAKVPLSDMLPFRGMQDLIASRTLRGVPTLVRRRLKSPFASALWLHPELLHLRPPAVTCRRGWLAPQSELKSDLAGAPVCANTGCGWLLFDHLVGTSSNDALAVSRLISGWCFVRTCAGRLACFSPLKMHRIEALLQDKTSMITASTAPIRRRRVPWDSMARSRVRALKRPVGLAQGRNPLRRRR